jgi:hypothetical protein
MERAFAFHSLFPSNNAKITRSASVLPGERNSSTTFTPNTRAIFSRSSSTNAPTPFSADNTRAGASPAAAASDWVEWRWRNINFVFRASHQMLGHSHRFEPACNSYPLPAMVEVFTFLILPRNLV